MTVIEKGEKIAKEIDDKISGSVVSAVVYGTDIHSEPKEGIDCNLVLVLDRIDPGTLETIETVIKEADAPCMVSPMLVEMAEIEGMMDSVPLSFLNILVSYQTVYGRSIFKGLSSLNHEHLRAQTEQSLREYLITARRRLYRSFSNDKDMHKEIEMMRGLLKRSIQLYCIIKKPWLTEDSEKWEAFFEEFQIDDIWLKKYYESDLRKLSKEDLRKMGFSIIDHGIKPILKKVDEMGPN
ncbi:MAG: hypothetical protein ACMUHM_01795 [Thermoplasmatota archaeon]